MKAQFVNLQAAADYMGPGAIEVDRYQTEITDIVRRRGPFGQRIKQVPATGHPSRFFEETAIPSPDGRQRLRRSAQHRADAGHAHARGAQRSAEVPGLADQLQRLRHGGRRTAEPVRLSCRRRTWPTPSKVCCARTTSRCGTATTPRCRIPPRRSTTACAARSPMAATSSPSTPPTASSMA